MAMSSTGLLLPVSELMELSSESLYSKIFYTSSSVVLPETHSLLVQAIVFE
jgi:hypothetical protein